MNLKRKVMLVFGTRPEAIKMAPLYHELNSDPDHFETTLCITAQHREMLDKVLKDFNIQSDIDLNLMQPNQTLSSLTSSVMQSVSNVLEKFKPDILLVHGDTTTAYASAVSAFYKKIDVGHIEAGLRTHNIFSPFPEEFNRQVISKVARYHFAPTQKNYENLIEEGVKQSSILITGNTVIDALFWTLNKIDNENTRKTNIYSELNSVLGFDWQSEKYILVTAHRRENFGTGLKEICSAIKDLALTFPTIHIVLPVHPNPNVKDAVYSMLSGIKNIHLIQPVDYQPFVVLLRNCYFVITDSGGIQEEAPSLGKPVLVTREITERSEAIEDGGVLLVGGSQQKIYKAAHQLISSPTAYKALSNVQNTYGDGRACAKISDFLRRV